MKNCEHCKHAEISKGAYTGTCYIECGLKREQAENLTEKELLYLIKHPEEQPCNYEKGKPIYCGITFDD